MHLFKKEYSPEYLAQCTVIDKKYRVLFTLGEGRYAKYSSTLITAVQGQDGHQYEQPVKGGDQDHEDERQVDEYAVGDAASLLDAFINEVSILSGLEHKHIVHVKDFEINGISQRHNGSCRRIVYYTMSLAENGELFRLIEETDAFG